MMFRQALNWLIRFLYKPGASTLDSYFEAAFEAEQYSIRLGYEIRSLQEKNKKLTQEVQRLKESVRSIQSNINRYSANQLSKHLDTLAR